MASQGHLSHQHIVVCCDGSWCGEATDTISNIQIIANSFAGEKVPSGKPTPNSAGTAVVYYYGGVGESGNFGDYLVDGALALSIKDRCVEAYRAIVNHYRPGVKIWLFGLSRGAYTVRSVAGMINNLGVLRKCSDEAQLSALCEEVYSCYRNRDKEYSPTSPFAQHFREKKSHKSDNQPPIRFVGLLDTVGALGVPKINAGVGLSYEFYDQIVSREVQTVCQALATHDRMSVFTPCFVRRRQLKADDTKHTHYETEEVWFPGSHYDIGRQRFVFGRKGHGLEGTLQRLQKEMNVLHTNVTYTNDLANGPLWWLITKAQAAQPPATNDHGKLLDQDPAYYTRRWAQDVEPATWNETDCAPYRKDAYDKMFSSAFGAAKALHLLPVVVDGLQDLLRDQLLADRNIPQSPVEPAVFFCASADGEAAAAAQFKTYTSQSFQHFEQVSFRGLIWASLPPQGPKRAADSGQPSDSG